MKSDFWHGVMKFIGFVLVGGIIYLNYDRERDRYDRDMDRMHYLEVENRRLQDEVRGLNKELNHRREIAPVAKE